EPASRQTQNLDVKHPNSSTQRNSSLEYKNKLGRAPALPKHAVLPSPCPRVRHVHSPSRLAPPSAFRRIPPPRRRANRPAHVPNAANSRESSRGRHVRAR